MAELPLLPPLLGEPPPPGLLLPRASSKPVCAHQVSTCPESNGEVKSSPVGICQLPVATFWRHDQCDSLLHRDKECRLPPAAKRSPSGNTTEESRSVRECSGSKLQGEEHAPPQLSGRAPLAKGRRWRCRRTRRAKSVASTRSGHRPAFGSLNKASRRVAKYLRCQVLGLAAM